MTRRAEIDTTAWLCDLGRLTTGSAPPDPAEVSRRVASIAAAVQRRRLRRNTVVLGASVAAAAVVALLMSTLSGRHAELSERREHYEAPSVYDEDPTHGLAKPRGGSSSHRAAAPAGRDTERPNVVASPEPAAPSTVPTAAESRASPVRARAPNRPPSTPEPAPKPSAEELLRRANEARGAHEIEAARAALTEIRARFPESTAAERATFLLGRVERELAGDEAAAQIWFSRYIAEHPSGRFAASARGRILAYLDAHGDAADARRAAREYLAHHGDGPYADLAQRVRGEGDPSE